MEVVVLAQTLPLVASNCTGPFANFMALEINVIQALLLAVEPEWRSNPRFAAAGTAIDYFKDMRVDALRVSAVLQTALSN